MYVVLSLPWDLNVGDSFMVGRLFRAKYLRNKDRQANLASYPNLFFPDIYILKGGYQSFYRNHKVRSLSLVFVKSAPKYRQRIGATPMDTSKWTIHYTRANSRSKWPFLEEPLSGVKAAQIFCFGNDDTKFLI